MVGGVGRFDNKYLTLRPRKMTRALNLLVRLLGNLVNLVSELWAALQDKLHDT